MLRTCGDYVEDMLIFAQCSINILSNQHKSTSTDCFSRLLRKVLQTVIRVVLALEKRRSDPRSDSGYANPGMRMEEGRRLGINELISALFVLSFVRRPNYGLVDLSIIYPYAIG